jgi:hypothetical protein
MESSVYRGEQCFPHAPQVRYDPHSFSDEFEKFFKPSVSAIVEGIKAITEGVNPSKAVRIRFLLRWLCELNGS